jgi:hypothetical protein
LIDIIWLLGPTLTKLAGTANVLLLCLATSGEQQIPPLRCGMTTKKCGQQKNSAITAEEIATKWSLL